METTNFEESFRAAQAEAFRVASEHGFHEGEVNDGLCLCLVHSEISEALQALRDGNPRDTHCPEHSALEVELADAVIRIMDYAGAKGLNLAGAIAAKMRFNEGRPYRHGKRF